MTNIACENKNEKIQESAKAIARCASEIERRAASIHAAQTRCEKQIAKHKERAAEEIEACGEEVIAEVIEIGWQVAYIVEVAEGISSLVYEKQ